MAEQLSTVNQQYDALAQQARDEMARLVRSKEWELAKTAVDAAGVVDPSPLSDGIGMVMSLAEGDPIGAGLSALSMVPYLGDAVGKTAKGARAVRKMKELTESIGKTARALDQYADKFARRRAAAERVRQARKTAPSGCVQCSARDRFGVSMLPSKEKGRWSGGEGDSSFQPGSWTGEPGKSTFVPDTTKPAVTYREGYPDFSPHVQKVNGVPAQVQIDMQGTYGRTGNGDFAVATQAMRDKLKDPTWTPDYDRYTWHHHEDGSTMQLVPKAINDGFPHTGGASIVKGPTGGKEF